MIGYTYRAFISYSHEDDAWAARIQRALERFTTPSALVGRQTPAGPVPPRLAPVFRDREDLPAAGDLSGSIREALAASRFLIVVCSPAATRSRWVAEEIRVFKQLHGAARVLAIIVDGEPGAAADPERAERECFPEPLRRGVGPAGDLTDEVAEPVAADARPAGDGPSLALLKLKAGLLGLRLDDLARRAAVRQARLMTGIAAGAGAVTLAMIGLALDARAGRIEATRQRDAAETLVDFMLRDLRDEVVRLGRLDVMEAVSREALAYYEGEPVASLDDASLLRRANALRQIGEIDLRRGDIVEAKAAFAAAHAVTGELLARAPGDADRVFDHAQSVFFVGEACRAVDERCGEDAFRTYYELAQRLEALEPGSARARGELVYATGNLGLLLDDQGRFNEAIPFHEERLALVETAMREGSDEFDAGALLAASYDNLELALANAGRPRDAAALARRRLAAAEALAAAAPEDFEALANLAAAQRALGSRLAWTGDHAEAAAMLAALRSATARLLERDASQVAWGRIAVDGLIAEANALAGLGEIEGARARAREAVRLAESLWGKRTDLSTIVTARIFACSKLLDLEADAPPALATAEAVMTDLSGAEAIAGGALVRAVAIRSVADRRAAEGDLDAARRHALEGAALLEPGIDRQPLTARLTLAQLYRRAGQLDAARAQVRILVDAGFARADLAKLAEELQSRTD